MRRRFSILSIKENEPNTPDNALTERLILTSNNLFLNEFFFNINKQKKNLQNTKYFKLSSELFFLFIMNIKKCSKIRIECSNNYRT